MPSKSSNTSNEGQEEHLVVGGCGFLGRYIVEQLLARGASVRVFDLRKGFEDSRVQFFVGNIRSADDLRPALTGVTTVYNTVSPPHGGTFQQYYGVNVEGTKILLEVARECGVKQFIHTSSSSVVFGGKDLNGVDETACFPKKHIDPYSHTKEIAETYVLSQNGKGGMLTVAIRPSGIFGPRDSQFFPTALKAAHDGKWKYQIGNGKNKQDFTYVGNVAHAHLLASDKLKENNNIGGQAYFITNDEPASPWKILGKMYTAFGYGDPYIAIPALLMIYFAMLVDLIVWILSPIVTLHPNFTYFRVVTVAANRYFNINKAKQDLGYKPIVPLWEALDLTIRYYQDQENEKPTKNIK
eukprot:Phypoly_transcript_05149.p1 GENE.Phypoly_transcript_05149~~Phypoly_transcript_05149.p1  ORF type:complete len:354 (+),score=60.59 Phypoly_transcript_05149:142-1203(+)